MAESGLGIKRAAWWTSASRRMLDVGVGTRQSWRRVTALVMTLAVVSTGCTGGSDEAAPIPTIELTTTTTPTTTTTTGPTTTAPPTTEDPNLAEIRDVYEEFFPYLVNHGLDETGQPLQDFAADPVLSRMINSFAEYRADGIKVGDTAYDIHILSVEIDGTRATLTSCNLDAVSLVKPSGEIYVPADEVRYIRVTELTLLDIGWRVTNTNFGDGAKTECEL